MSKTIKMNDTTLVRELIKKYSIEFSEEVWPFLPESQYQPFECFILYALVREHKPLYVADLGTEHNGRSTHVIQRALLKNGGDFVHQLYDGVANVAKENLEKSDLGSEGLEAYEGLIQDHIGNLAIDKCDFLFIDADHALSFAVWFLDNIINHLKKESLVHIHDINLSGDWDWIETKDSEGEELLARHVDGTLQLEPLLWLENFGINIMYDSEWNFARKHLPMIGDWPLYSDPYWKASCTATYWKKL